MKKYDSNQYVEIFYKLPPEIKDVVASDDTIKRIWAIGEKHRLHIDKIGVMNNISYDVIMGLIPSRNFSKELASELQISLLEAAAVARDIDEEIFKPIKKIMIAMYGDGAPNKPSSSLVTLEEEDDVDHGNLEKDKLLKEIENPTAAVARVERVPARKEEAGKLVSLLASKPTKEVETMAEVSDLHNLEKRAGIKEASKLTSLPAYQLSKSDKLTSSPANKLTSSPSMLEKIATMKLSQSFVMPKEAGQLESLSAGQEDIRKNGKLGSEEVVQEKIQEDMNSLRAKKEEITDPFSEKNKVFVPPARPVPGFKLGEQKTKPPVPTQMPAPAQNNPPPAKNYGSDPYREPLN
ncbi:MAG TPA: hypothetical protein VJH63_04300 [Candidatus Paceibacterota bacterium]